MNEYPGTREWTEAGVSHLEVRALAAPHPLIAILRRVQRMERDEELVVHHHRDPVMLYPELEAMGWEALPVEAPAGEVRLRLRALR